MASDQLHWNSIFSNTETTELGWFEAEFSATEKLLNKIPDWEEATIFLAGIGVSGLADKLYACGASLVLNDISSSALEQLKARLQDADGRTEWLCHDLSTPLADENGKVDVWIDRAVLHFLTEEADIATYFENLRSMLNVGGYALFAEFSETGAKQCAGLSVKRYSTEEVANRLGAGFELVEEFDHEYINPSGSPRPYIYALFKRVET
jgi:2-polyprenyl-3-methyl-5-hydroxy-6-metoxy-1,4-benzoquinol methylase